jgi:hypothetical protein
MTKTGAQNAITNDTFSDIALPTTQVDDQALLNERNMAKFSKTREFKVLKEYLENRIDFFQKYLPDGRPLTTDNVSDKDWVVANLVIGEFKSVLQAYEDAATAVRNATTQ